MASSFFKKPHIPNGSDIMRGLNAPIKNTHAAVDAITPDAKYTNKSYRDNNEWYDWLLSVANPMHAFKTISRSTTNKRNDKLYQDLISKGYTPEQAEALVNQYGDTAGGFFEMSKFGDDTDYEALAQIEKEISDAYAKYGDYKTITGQDLDDAEQRAYAQLDNENNELEALFKQSLGNSTNLLNNSLVDNSRMFNAYRNQMLTNDAMNQQAIAGSTRFELDRQQRNSIIRGASAAQRLVANINTQLGTQAQSAQQALNTSNALAQALVNQRQAQQNIRDQYMNAQNQYNNNMASMISGSTERRNAYGQQARDQLQYNTDQYNKTLDDNLSRSGLGSTSQGIYKSRYSSNYNNSNNTI